MSITIENLNHIYNEGTPFQSIALDNVNLTIEDGDFVGLIGHTGSGKSTLIQTLNGLIKPTSGKILINGTDITQKNISLVDIRKKVGLVFQYPEYQLFEETIYKDIAFGPEKLGLTDIEIEERVIEAMIAVGLDPEKSKDKSPFELSGGQKRRVAIAGVIAMRPDVLILDEPTAGLDPHGRDEILQQIKIIHEKNNTTVIIVSHSMEDMSKLAKKLVVMNRGKIEFVGSPKEVFRNEQKLNQIGLGVPKVVTLMNELRAKGYEIEPDIITMDEAKKQIIKLVRSKNNA